MSKKKYAVYGLATASQYIGEYEAESKEEAEQMAWKDVGFITLCHHCSRETDVGDIYELDVSEAK